MGIATRSVSISVAAARLVVHSGTSKASCIFSRQDKKKDRLARTREEAKRLSVARVGCGRGDQLATGMMPGWGTGGTGGGAVDQRPKPVIRVAPRPTVQMRNSTAMPVSSRNHVPVRNGSGATPKKRDR